MSQIDELLNSLSEEDIATYSVDPTIEEHIIVQEDRTVIVPDILKNVAVQFDHNVETVAFDCPRYWDGLDMSTMSVHINYMRADGIPGTTPALHVAVDSENPDVMHFHWVITKHATLVQGPLKFLVCIKRVDEDGTEENHWNSELNTEMYISEGLECSGTPLDQHPDVITYLLLRINEITETSINQYLLENPLQLDPTLTDNQKAANAAATGTAIAELATEIDDFKQEVTDNMDEFYSDAGFVRQHVWRRRTYSPESYSIADGELYTGRGNEEYTKDGYLTMAYYGDQSGGSDTTVYYTDTLSINASTGAFIPGTITTLVIRSDNSSNLTSLRGKYWAYDKAALSSNDGAVYHSSLNAQYKVETEEVEVSEDITETITVVYFEYPTIVSRRHTPEITGEPELFYTDSDTITKDPGYRYDYLGLYRTLPTRMAFTEKISYKGTGTFGASNPTRLTFAGIPSMIVISAGKAAFGSTTIITYGQNEAAFFPCNGVTVPPGSYPRVTWTNNVGGGCTVSIYVAATNWYGSANEAWQQFNEVGVSYTVVAIY